MSHLRAVFGSFENELVALDGLFRERRIPHQLDACISHFAHPELSRLAWD